MGLHLLNSRIVTRHLSWNEAFVLSTSGFHEHGFFNPTSGFRTKEGGGEGGATIARAEGSGLLRPPAAVPGPRRAVR
jgi:hypothetical protein